jgi:integrase
LGTRHEDAAQRLANKIERALAEGANSGLWSELHPVLPARAFKCLSGLVGYEPRPQTPLLTWGDLLSSFEREMEHRISLHKFRESTRNRYRQTAREFEAFLSHCHVSRLCDITRPMLESFKVWRAERIRAKKHSRGATSIALDAAILHRIFALAVEWEMIQRNPVRMEGRPGDNPERGAQPFEAEQLAKMRQHAGPDLLAFLILRWTGMRGSDVATLEWRDIRFDRREIERVTQKRNKKIILPLHVELFLALQAERNIRHPQLCERVLLNPSTGNPLTRPRLYERMLALGRRAGVSGAHPHRFRDTLAVDMLLRGASPYDIAKMLGDTIETIEKHYTPFVRELRDRVRLLLESGTGLENLPKFLLEGDQVSEKKLI